MLTITVLGNSTWECCAREAGHGKPYELENFERKQTSHYRAMMKNGIIHNASILWFTQ